jgi:hypothetical protein
MFTTASAAYRALLLSLRSGAAPLTCVVADGIMPFAVDIAEELGIPALSFRTASACSFLAYLSVPRLVELHEVPFPADDPVRGVPGMEGFLRRWDLPRAVARAEDGVFDPMLLTHAEGIAQAGKARALILNTAASMEGPALSRIAPRMPDVFAIGPLHATRSAGAGSLWREDDGCLAWLDGHGVRSVVASCT